MARRGPKPRSFELQLETRLVPLAADYQEQEWFAAWDWLMHAVSGLEVLVEGAPLDAEAVDGSGSYLHDRPDPGSVRKSNP